MFCMFCYVFLFRLSSTKIFLLVNSKRKSTLRRCLQYLAILLLISVVPKAAQLQPKTHCECEDDHNKERDGDLQSKGHS